MTEKMRKRSFYFPEGLSENLQDYCEKTKQYESEIVRVSVSKYLMEHPLKIEKAVK